MPVQPGRTLQTTQKSMTVIGANPRPTAGQQKENPSDRAMTQQIRRAILQDKSLSTYAHNVKVITQDGNVILKGPVRSIGEKKTVEAKRSRWLAKTE